MFSIEAEGTQLSANDVSAILNCLCPRCGGPLGGPAREFKCQGQCGKDWRSDWENNHPKREAAREANGRLRTSRSLKTRIQARTDQVLFMDRRSKAGRRSA